MSGLQYATPELAQWLPPDLVPPQWHSLVVRQLTLDSRLVKPGDGFFALASDEAIRLGHIQQAVTAGAILIIAEQGITKPEAVPSNIAWVGLAELASQISTLAANFYGNPCRHLPVVGVTGTNGKSTCVYLLAQLLSAITASPAGIVGTLGYGLVGQDLIATGMTTPDVISNQRILRELLDQGATAVAMEVSSHGLDQQRVNGLAFTAAIFTNLTRDHLDYHRTMEAYGAAKARLFGWPGLQVAAINGQADGARLMQAAVRPETKLLTYGIEANGADIWAENVRYSAAGASFDLHSPWGVCPLVSPLMGEFNVQNLLAVIAVALQLHPQAWLRLPGFVGQLQAVPGRMQQIIRPAQPSVVVDYAHTPDALAQTLTNLRRHCRGKLWLVFGCGGDRDRGKRPLMAAVAERLADQVIVTYDNPRHENPASILADIQAGFTASDAVHNIPDRGQAILQAIHSAAADDWVLIAGKGHETYQLIGDQVLPFDDYAEALSALDTRGEV